jgi:peptidoglycan/xylan/chitin deacetylase (PgdA/CDA1 family)
VLRPGKHSISLPLFIHSYGEANDAVVKHLNGRGYTVANWDVDSGDSAGVDAQTSIARLQAFKSPDVHLPLNHETYSSSANIVAPAVIPYLRAEGYKLVTVAQCLNNVSPYKIQGKRQERDSTWTCSGSPAPGAAS